MTNRSVLPVVTRGALLQQNESQPPDGGPRLVGVDEEGVTVATRLVARRFADVRAAWLGGSVAAGQQTSTSDLDITVLLAGPPAPYRSSEVADGWPVEYFVQTEETLLRFCEVDRDRRRPTTMRLVGSSIILVDRDGSGRRLQAALHQMDLAGPPAVTDRDLETRRYAITDLLADLTAPRSDDESLMVASVLMREVAEFVLAAHRRWSGSGKWLLRELVSLDRDAHTQYAKSLTDGLHSAATGNPTPLHAVTVAVLHEFGGPVFAGFRRDAPPAVAPSLSDGLRVRPMTVRDAELVATWRYSGPCAVYDVTSAQPILDDLPDYFAVTSGERLVGFCCVGHAARIPGLTEQVDVLDVGLGMDPELVGLGCGDEFGRTVLAFLVTTHPDQELRAVVQDWNERSLRLTRQLGFEDAGELTAVQGGHQIAYRIVKHRAHKRN